MEAKEAIVVGGKHTTNMNVRSEPLPPHETIVESPNLHIIHMQASSLNLVDVLNVQSLPLPLSPKG